MSACIFSPTLHYYFKSLNIGEHFHSLVLWNNWFHSWPWVLFVVLNASSVLSLLCRRQTTSWRRNSVVGWDTNCSTSNAWWRTTTRTTHKSTESRRSALWSQQQTLTDAGQDTLQNTTRTLWHPETKVPGHTPPHTFIGNILCVDLVFSLFYSDQIYVRIGVQEFSCRRLHSSHCHFFLSF